LDPDEITDDRAARASRRHERWIGLALLALLALIYLESPRRIFLDSRYALLTSEALLDRGSFDLTPYLPWQVEKVERAVDQRPRLPYQLMMSGGRLFYLYPPGTSLLSLPLVPVLRLFGESAVDAEGYYTASGERSAQALLAALISALTGWLIYRAAVRELTPIRAATLSLAIALTSGLWSVASRLLWSHCWATFLTAAVWVELLRWQEGRRPRPLLLGALLSMAFWVRPTGVALILPVTLYVFLRYRSRTFRLLAAGTAGALFYVGVSFLAWKAPLPPYTTGAIGLIQRHDLLLGIAGMLFSPGRGMFFYAPYFLLAAWLLLRHGVDRPRRALIWLAASIFAAYVLLYTSWNNWWGFGFSGPRFVCDMTPPLAWLCAVAWRRTIEFDRSRAPRRAVAVLRDAVAVLLVAAAFAAHAPLALDRGYDLPSKRQAKSRRAAAKYAARFAIRPAYWSLRAVPQVRMLKMLGIDVGGVPQATPEDDESEE